jgi:hypothetical protein
MAPSLVLHECSSPYSPITSTVSAIDEKSLGERLAVLAPACGTMRAQGKIVDVREDFKYRNRCRKIVSIRRFAGRSSPGPCHIPHTHAVQGQNAFFAQTSL